MSRSVLQSSWWRGQSLPRVAVVAAVAVLLAILAYRQVDRWRGGPVTAWIAAADLEEGTAVTAEQLRPVETRARALPRNALLDFELDELVGREVLRAKTAGETLLKKDLGQPLSTAAPGLAEVVPEGRVMMVVALPGFPIADLYDSLRIGDRFDLFTLGPRDAGPLHMARDLIFMGWVEPLPAEDDGDDNGGDVGSGLVASMTEAAAASLDTRAAGPGPLLLAVRPEDVRRLVWVQGTRTPLTVVIHGQKEVESGALLPFPDVPGPDQVEVITGSRRQRIPIQQEPR